MSKEKKLWVNTQTGEMIEQEKLFEYLKPGDRCATSHGSFIKMAYNEKKE